MDWLRTFGAWVARHHQSDAWVLCEARCGGTARYRLAADRQTPVLVSRRCGCELTEAEQAVERWNAECELLMSAEI